MIDTGPRLAQDSAPSRDRSFSCTVLMIICVAILLLLVAMGGYYLGKSQADSASGYQRALAPPNPSDPIQPPSSPTIAPQKQTDTTCNASDKEFCVLLDSIQPLIRSENFLALVTYQNPQEVTCDDEARAIQGLPTNRSVNLCKGIPEGGKTRGYSVGYNQSEVSTMTTQEYTNTLESYFATHKPFNYAGSVVRDGKGYIVYTDSNNKYLFALPVMKYGSSWKLVRVTLGLLSTDFTSLDPIILGTVDR